MRKILSYLLVTLSFALCFNVGLAQSNKQYFDAYKAVGDSCLAERNYYGAHQAFAKALEFDQKAEVAYNCAEACRSYQNYNDAEKYYRMTNSLDSVTYRLASFWLADLLKMRGKYDEAVRAYEQFYQANQKHNDYFTVRAQQEITICKNSVKNIPIQDIRQYRIENKKINTMYTEYSPVQYNDSLFFYGAVHAINQELADTSLVFSNYTIRLSKSRVRDSEWSTPVILDSLNDPNMYVGNLTFSGDGKTVYFSKCAGYDCALYKADFDAKRERFSNTQKLPSRINLPHTSNTTPHLAVTPQGEVLFWSSDRGDGKGGFDIWYSRINQANGSFENPRNCGTNINTPGDEVTPFYDARDSLLYFSSEWHAGLGGFDVFASKADLRNNKFAKVSNVGEPINSSYNDLYYNFSRDSLRAYWVSNREESTKLLGIAHGNDIYYHTLSRKTVHRLSDLIPITLYFDNDFPNPRSKDSTTTDVYSQLFRDYMLQRNNFIYGFTKTSSVASFSNDVRAVEAFFQEARNEYNKLELFAQLVNILCDDGMDIVVALKGYASPVGFTDYNEILAKRRISCIQNYFDEFNNGSLKRYTKNEPNTGKGSLRFIQEPIGALTDEAILPNASEQDRMALSDRAQRWKSVYSPTASRQRKTEIVAVAFEERESLLNEIRSEVKATKRQIGSDEWEEAKRQRIRQQIPMSRDYDEAPDYKLDKTIEFNYENTPAPEPAPAAKQPQKEEVKKQTQQVEVETNFMQIRVQQEQPQAEKKTPQIQMNEETSKKVEELRKQKQAADDEFEFDDYGN